MLSGFFFISEETDIIKANPIFFSLALLSTGLSVAASITPFSHFSSTWVPFLWTWSTQSDY